MHAYIIILGTVDGILLNGIHALLAEKSFYISARPAQLALNIASSLLQWAPNHSSDIGLFENEVKKLLSSCLSTQSKLKGFKPEIWQKYHQIRTSDSYQSLWHTFIKTSVSIAIPSPMFLQYVGHHAFKELIKEHFPIRSSKELNMQMNLTYEELNGIRYAAGFVPRAIKKKLQNKKKKLDNPLNKDCLLCLEELMSGDGDTELSSADWVNSINRGGLICVNDMTFELFLSMELELRSHLKINPTHLGDEVVVRITESEDVLFLWSIISASWDNDCSTALLKKIAKMWTTVRGFSYASAWVEKMKVAQQKLHKNLKASGKLFS